MSDYDKDFVRVLLNNLEEAIFLLDKTTITFANEMAKSFFGPSEGMDIFDLLIFEKSTLLVDSIHERKPLNIESKVFLSKKGGWCDFYIRYIPEIEALLMRDVSFIKIIEEAKLNMSVLISHELKNPLGVIESIVSDMLENEEDEEKIEKLWKIEKQSKRLNRIIQQIEYITMAQLGLYVPRKETLNVQKIISEVMEEIEELRKKKEIEISINLETKTIEADGFIIRTILKNLLSNALKYSFEKSKVILEFSAERMSIQDFGIGVPDSEKEKIFGRFYRTPSAVKMASGSGLGLAVVKHLANIAGYSIEFESKHLIGTKVTVWFKK